MEDVIAGVEVRVRSRVGAIPDQASVIECGGTVIDDGDGTELCLGGVQESYPPQCDGPVVDIEMGDWATVEGGVAFGQRTMVLTWPPVGGSFEVIDDRAYEPVEGWPSQQLVLPEGCSDIDEFVGVEVLAAYAADHPNTTAAPAVVDGGRIGVLQVVESAIDDVRADLTTSDAEPCLWPVEYSTSELLAAQDAIGEASLTEPDLFIGSTGSGNAFNRVTVDLLVADVATINRLADFVDDPSMLLAFGMAEIVAGS